MELPVENRPPMPSPFGLCNSTLVISRAAENIHTEETIVRNMPGFRVRGRSGGGVEPQGLLGAGRISAYDRSRQAAAALGAAQGLNQRIPSHSSGFG
jgi:hypothetical protein